jgi:type IV pilus assembly protein PilB
LYATLNILNDESKNIITVEDPVEYRLPNINQVQVNAKAGLTFAVALRSILRSDPDILLVGEIRDRETATIAIEAALTGHLVLSTLHTNDSATTAMRLIEMGVEPFLVGSAIDCIVAQRLARRLCERCKAGVPPTFAEQEMMAEHQMEAYDTTFRPVGCGHCGRTGYMGRFALHEVLVVNESIERIICDRGHAEDMISLRRAGLEHVRLGITAVEEILRVVA